MPQARILLADDDELIVDVLSYQLKKEGYEVVVECVSYRTGHGLDAARVQRLYREALLTPFVPAG